MSKHLVWLILLGAGLTACGGGGGDNPANISDPLFADQWNLQNTGQPGKTGVAAKVGEDINVTGAWASTKGEGVKIAIVDDGLEIAHEDLVDNVGAGLSYNYAANGFAINNPSYLSTDSTSGHGTSCAGIAAARDLNGKGGRGVAPRATLVGYNVLQSQTALMASNEADAMTRNAANISVSSNSWGAPDGTGELFYAPISWTTAINTGLSTGRGGKGILYIWAAGNGRRSTTATSDNSNSDGQANYRGVTAVAAVSDQGVQSSYSESGANLWVSAPGGEYCTTHAITTVDRTGVMGFNTVSTAGGADYADQAYTKCMNGTSSAAPTVAGVAALMLAANPNLGWRDVKIILAKTARKNDTGGLANWAGKQFNHKYGFGVVDATAAVAMAKTWTNVGPELSYATAVKTPAVTAIPAYVAATDPGISDTIAVSGSGISSIEWVEVTLSATNSMSYDGDLDVTLTNQNTGMVSQLAVPHYCSSTAGSYVCSVPYTDWVFGSAAHLGEAADATWKLTVKEGLSAGGTGTFVSWKLKFYGH